MKIGNKVMVNWPTGKGGPYYTDERYNDGSIKLVNTDGQTDIIVPADWCEPFKSTIEKGRWCKFWDRCPQRRKLAPFAGYQDGLPMDDEDFTWDYVEPLFRRWNELTEDERVKWISDQHSSGNITLFEKAYKLITGEDHPQ